jgi:hypothetical protein
MTVAFQCYKAPSEEPTLTAAADPLSVHPASEGLQEAGTPSWLRLLGLGEVIIPLEQ